MAITTPDDSAGLADIQPDLGRFNVVLFDILKPLVYAADLSRDDLLRGIAEFIPCCDDVTQSDMEDIMRVIQGW